MATTTSQSHPLLLATSAAYGVLALGHTVNQVYIRRLSHLNMLTTVVDERYRPIQTSVHEHTPDRAPRRFEDWMV